MAAEQQRFMGPYKRHYNVRSGVPHNGVSADDLKSPLYLLSGQCLVQCVLFCLEISGTCSSVRSVSNRRREVHISSLIRGVVRDAREAELQKRPEAGGGGGRGVS